MKNASTLLLVLFLAGCMSEDRIWYNRLNAVDSGRISDSAIWAISKDHEMVLQIEHVAAESEAFVRMRQREDSLYHAMPLDTIAYFGGGTDTHLHSAIMQGYDSIEAAYTLRIDSVVLNLDSLTLMARSGNTEAQKQLEIRHRIEGDINGLWTSNALRDRDDSMRSQITEIKARFARSDTAKAMLARLK